MNDEILENLLEYDYTEIQKIPSQLQGIEQNTKQIIEELQKNNEGTKEFQSFLMESTDPLPVEEPPADEPEEVPTDEAVTEETILDEEITDVPLDEVPEEEVTEEVLEEIPAETEEPIDYMPLIYEELQTQNVLLEEMLDNQSNDSVLLQEGFMMLVFALVIVVAVKVFIDQITKW